VERVRCRLFLFSILFCGLVTRAFAAPPTFGNEIELTNREIDQAEYEDENFTQRISDENSDMQDRFYEEVYAICKGCKIRMGYDYDGTPHYKVTYPDGWWFKISLDPAVLEIQTAPSTVKKLKQIRNRIQTDIFGVAKTLGLKAGFKGSGGHIHIGAESAFGGDANLFRNFLVDFINHSELANGILENDHSNAPPLQSLTPEQKRGFLEVIKDFDEGRRKTIHDIAEGLISQVYYESTEETWAPAEKFHAINVVRIFEILIFNKSERTVEVRCLRGQSNVDELIAEAELFEARLNYLKKLPGPLQVTWGPAASDKQGLLNAFYRYVTESGLKWETYQKLLPKKFQAIRPNRAVSSTASKDTKQKTEIKREARRSNTNERSPATINRITAGKRSCAVALGRRIRK
jgi:hypothetical protein